MKKYQVFVSSTYQDLVEERKEVIQALLELDCIPVGMELFPATDDDQWTLIKELIDDCDYYILIVGGRYGSLNKEGISYTQQEYEYAIEIGIPTISFIHKSPDDIVVSKTDKDEQKAEKLKEFRTLVQEKLVKPWVTPSDLGSVVSRSLVKLIRTKPRVGWVKADSISSTEANLEILTLKKRIQDLENELQRNTVSFDNELSSGDDKITITYSFKESGLWKQDKVDLTWNKIFAKTCTLLIVEATEDNYRSMVNQYIKHRVKRKHDIDNLEVNIITDTFMSVLIQFKALGLIEKSSKKRSLKDLGTYWKLTQKGDDLLTHLRAIRKDIEIND